MADEKAKANDTPIERYPSLEEDWRRLGNMANEQITSAVAGFLRHESIHTLDLFLIGVAERALHLTYGFMAAFEAWNLVVAAPLVRLQIDNLVRISYVGRYTDGPSPFDVLNKEFREMFDADGKRLTDSRLVDLAKPHHPWVPGVYRAANDWVHLSPQQILSPFTIKTAGRPGEFEMALRHVVDDYPEKFLSEVLASMLQCTLEIVSYFSLWEVKKFNPDWKLGTARPTDK